MGAPLPPVPNLIQAQVQGAITGEVWENVFHFSYLGPPPSTTSCVTIASSIRTQWSVHMQPLQVGVVQTTNVIVTDLSSVTGAQGASGTTSPGTRTGEGLGANTAVLVSYPSPSRFKGGHFRSYLLAGNTADMLNPMDWLPSFTTEVNTAVQAFINTVIGISAAGTQLIALIGLRRHGKFLPNGGPPHYILTTPVQLTLDASNILVHTQMASQKGRIGRRSK